MEFPVGSFMPILSRTKLIVYSSLVLANNTIETLFYEGKEMLWNAFDWNTLKAAEEQSGNYFCDNHNPDLKNHVIYKR